MGLPGSGKGEDHKIQQSKALILGLEGSKVANLPSFLKA